ncbi:MAG: DNA polymerase Y family protein [Acidobacteriota bacterium]
MSDPAPFGGGGPRILCAWVPLFPLAARLRAEPELYEEAVAVLAGNGAAARVVAATRRARRAGVRPGFTLSQARSRLPKLIARPRDVECERSAQQALLDVAESFSPRVEDGGEGLAFLDVEGLARHYPGDDAEGDLGRAVIHAMEQRARLVVRAGVAASKLSAQVAAHDPASPRIVPAGDEAAFLATQPLDRLSPQAATLATLERWGVRTLGELARLPTAEVISRLGPAGEELHCLARGDDPRPLEPRTPPPTFREGLELEWPLVSLEPFLFVARAALERITQRMRGHGLGCRRLELSMALEPDGRHERSIDLPAPTRDVKTLLTLLRLDLEAQRPGAPILAFHLVGHPDRPRAAQLSLFGPDTLSPDKLATTLARLFALLGEDRVGSPRPRDEHRPETFDLVPFAPPSPPAERPAPTRKTGAGLLTLRVLRPPLPVEVMTDGVEPSTADPSTTFGPSGSRAESPSDKASPTEMQRPVSVQSVATEATAKMPKIHGTVRVAAGPWALEQAWWAAQPVERDYWDIELSRGGLYRLYRERPSGDWFVDGVYE